MTHLPDKTLQELKALLAKATPGPWTVFENELRSSQHCGEHVVVESDTTWWFNKDLTNLKLLEALRNTAEALIAEVEAGRRARQLLDELRELALDQRVSSELIGIRVRNEFALKV